MFLCACIPPDLGVDSLVPAQAIRPPALAHIKNRNLHTRYITQKKRAEAPFSWFRWLVTVMCMWKHAMMTCFTFHSKIIYENVSLPDLHLQYQK